jgi:hypothetical protein
VNIGQDAQDPAGGHGVRGDSQGRFGGDRGEGEGLGAGGGGIDEDDLPPADQVQGVLDLELEVGEQVAVGEGALGLALRQALQQCRAQGVVAAGGVAASEDQDGPGGLRPRPGQRWTSPLGDCSSRSRTSPAGPTSVSSNGILPTAWVAQDRQGS